MGTWHEARWHSAESGGTARQRRSGQFRWYLPTTLSALRLSLPGSLNTELAQVERRVRELSSGPSGEDLAALARFLVRSEAIASSRIEGIAPAGRTRSRKHEVRHPCQHAAPRRPRPARTLTILLAHPL